MEWTALSSEEELYELIESSRTMVVCIYKHSTRCSLSSMIKSRLESGWTHFNETKSFYFLDVLKNRELSDLVADKFLITHQSPQLIVLKEGAVVHHSSHTSVTPEVLAELL